MRALAGLAELNLQTGETAQGLARYDEAVRLAEHCLDAREQAELHAAGIARWQVGEFDGSEKAIRAAISSDPMAPRYHLTLSMLRWHQGRLLESRSILEALLSAHPQAAKFSSLYHDLGVTYWMQAEVPTAEHWLLKSVEQWTTAGDLSLEAMSHLGLAMVRLSTGRYVEAQDGLELALARFESFAATPRIADVYARKSLLAYYLADYETAHKHFCQAEGLLRPIGNPYYLSYALAFGVGSLLGLERLAEAEAVSSEALALAERLGHPLTLLIALSAVTETALTTGDRQKARQASERGIELARRCEMPEHLSRMLFSRARVAAAGKKKKNAFRWLNEAFELATAHGLMRLSWRSGELLADLSGDQQIGRKAEVARQFLQANSPVWRKRGQAW